jgi:CubicO group peptidase (beta-lactamase class C family)
MKRTLILLIAVPALAYGLSLVTDNAHVWNGLRQCYLRGYKNAQVDDLRFQETRVIGASKHPRPWPLHSRFDEVRIPEAVLDSARDWNTVALAVVHRDSLLLSWTSDRIPGADTMRTNAFSAAKTLAAMAIGVAETDGLLSVQDRVSKYLPRFSEGPAADLTIEHVLQMRSGIPYGENYKNPFGFMAKCTYGKDILDRLPHYTVEGTAGIPWEYQGGNTLLLQEILLQVIDEPFGSWFNRRIWDPLGAPEEARWGIDNAGHERNYCCFYTTAAGYARLGQLVLDSGKVNGRTLISPDFIGRMTTPIGILPDGTNIQHYGYQIWMGEYKGFKFQSMQGLHGQYVVVVPDLDLVAVRTGFFRPKGKIREVDVDVYSTLDMAMTAMKPQ